MDMLSGGFPMMQMPMMGMGQFPSPVLGGGGGLPGAGLGIPGMDGFTASPEMAEHPWASGKTGFEGLDVQMPGMGGSGMPDMSALMGGLGGGGLDMGLGGMGLDNLGLGGMDMGLGGGSLANQAAMLQAGMGDANLANSALMGAEAVGLKNGAQQGQILGDAFNLGLG